ncbi:antibiotic resistance protein VanZ [Bradyrhizobium nanningense]|uniref:Antibiotic resistance protein VanZ n=1 Tax=Bradyrhizobium nanningense TaxID=1325118 RepID=A0A4Q0S3X0_9BRAD|nr:VanZ family protein [Bradyrhizobium nanningense]RXH27859.1 antibiotic resistance protein VanZ [Bradyrhizobium nanningense]RXH34227.1 antibiotic resistance protein VanZ [Bradyrhizobium nanningense]
MSILVRSIAWLLAAAVTFATLGPPGLRPHSDFGQDGEHALAFILVGLAFGLAYPRRRLQSTAAAVILIGVLELMQFWAPGRHARLEDFLVDALTACIGFALAASADWLLSRFRASPAVTSESPAE